MIATSNTMIAKIFAALAVAGLVVSSVAVMAPVAGAQTTTTTTTTTSASVSFSRDLTIGSTGADVTALQNWLISKGHGIAAGATGYFGAQSKAALAAYQAANGISPAVGYFGPITRAKVNASAGSTSGGGTGTGTGSGSTSGLSGGEANLTSFNLVREESSGDEGEEEVEAFTVEFDVDGGDVRVERMEITASSTGGGTMSKNPWDYFDRVTIWVDGDEVADMDVDNRNDWDKIGSSNVYELTLTGLDIVVEEGDEAEITVAFDIARTIDSTDINQSFDLSVKKDAIRAVDAAGIQQYIGSENDGKVAFGFGAADNGDLRIKSSDEDPDASILVGNLTRESNDYTVFAFEIENKGDADSLVTDLTVRVATTSTALTNMVRTATLVIDGDKHKGAINFTTGAIVFDGIDVEVGAEDDVEAEVMVTLKASSTAGTVTFSVAHGDIEAEGVDSGDASKKTGTATGKTHTVALTGIAVKPVSATAAVSNPQVSSTTTGTYTIKFDVTAIEGDTHISNAVATAGTNGVVYDIFGSATSTSYAGTIVTALTSTANTSAGGRFLVREGQTRTFTLSVTLDPSAAQTLGVRLDKVNFNTADAAGNTVFTADSSNQSFRTDTVFIAH